MDYQPPYKAGAVPAKPGIHNDDADASYDNGDETTGREGSYIPGEGVEHTQREIIKALTSSGIVPDHAVLEQLAESQSRSASLGIGAVCTGVANAYVLSAIGDTVVPKALFDGMIVVTEAVATNTGASTANVFGLGIKALRTYADAALVEGEVVLGRPTAWRYKAAADGGNGAWLILPWATAIQKFKPGALDATTLSVSGPTGSYAQTGYRTAVNFGTVVANTRNGTTWNNATGRLTVGAGESGQWQSVMTVEWADPGMSMLLLVITKNGTPIAWGQDGSSQPVKRITASHIGSFNVGDWIAFTFFYASSTSPQTPPSWFLCGAAKLPS